MRISELYYRPGIVQGEGALLGTPMPFIRVAGCNLSCSWCDSKYTWQHGYDYTEMSVTEIVDQVRQWKWEHHFNWVSITGGEPTIYADDIDELCANFWVDPYLSVIVETNGLRHIDAFYKHRNVFVSCSPKLPGSGQDNPRTRAKVRRFVAERAKLDSTRTQYKFVIANEQDLADLPAYCVDVGIPLTLSDQSRSPVYVQPDGYIQPMDKYLQALQWLQESAPASVRVTPQVHRLVHGPDARGV